MQAVMEEDPEAADGGSPVGSIADGPAPAYAGEPAAEDSLDWEFPGDRERESVPEDIPGQERLSSSSSAAARGAHGSPFVPPSFP